MPTTIGGIDYFSTSEQQKAKYDRKYGPKPKGSNAESQANRIRSLKLLNESLLSQISSLEAEIKYLRLKNAMLADEANHPSSFGISAVPPEMLKRLIRLCHPDRHDNSAMANEATSWLLSQRP